MRCARCGSDKKGDCFSRSQRNKPAATRKCSACATATGSATAPPPRAGAAVGGAGGTRTRSGGDTDRAPLPTAANGASNSTTPAPAEEAAATAPPASIPSPPPPAKTCSWAACGRELSADAAQNKRCSRCKSEFYCARACQKKHWGEGGHKDACEEPPCCNICLEGGDEPLPIQRGCACRGDAGLAHTACLAKANAHKADGFHQGWAECPTCGQWYTGAMQLVLARTLAHRMRLRHRNDRSLANLEHRTLADERLGGALRVAGEHAEAISVQKRVISVTTRVLGKEHPSTLDAVGNLSATYYKQGRFAEAEELQVRVLEASKRVRTTEHPETLVSAGNLAATYSRQGRFAEAEKLETWVLEVRERERGKDHKCTLNAVNNLAVTYFNQGRLAEADALQVRVLEVSERVLGDQHPDTIRAADNLTRARDMVSRYAGTPAPWPPTTAGALARARSSRGA